MLRRLIPAAAGFLALLCTGGAAAAARPSARPAPVLARRIAVWVQNAASNSVLPVDASTHRPRTPVRVRDPFAMAITPDGKTVYVSGLHSVVPINTATGRAGKPIPIRRGPGQIVVTPNGKLVYVAAGNTVVPIRVATNRAGRPIIVARRGDGPEGFGVTPDSKTVYAIDGATVVPVHTATGKAGKPIRTGATFTQMVVTPDGRTGYVLGFLNTVIPIDLASNSAERPITVGGRQSSPWALAITPDGKTVYVANYGNGTLVPIRTATNTAGTPIRVGHRPSFVAITPDGKSLYLVTDHAVYPVRTATNKAQLPVRLTFTPHAIAITPDGSTVWVSGFWVRHKGNLNLPGAGFVMPFSTATHRHGRVIRTGRFANCLVIKPWRADRVIGPTACNP